MHVLFVLRKHGSGKATILCRISVNGQRAKTDFSTGVKCLPEHWDSSSQCLKSKAMQEDNRWLLNMCSEIKRLYNDMLANGQNPTAETLKKAFLNNGKPCPSVLEWADCFLGKSIKLIGKTITEPTYLHYEQRLAVIKRFLKQTTQENLLLSNVCHRVLDRFCQWMAEMGYSDSYKRKNIQFFKLLLKEAYLNEVVQTFPLQFYRLPQVKRNAPVYLTQLEVQQLQEYKFSSAKLQQVADLLLFSCYTGLAYNDLQRFCTSWITKKNGIEWILYRRAKTNTAACVPLDQATKNMIAKYNGQLPKITNQKMNSYLKEIGEIVGIEKKLVTHIGRKTFTNIMLDKGFSAGAVAAMNGHTDERVTLTYYGSYNLARVEKEMINLTA